MATARGVIILLLISQVSSIYEDQAGKFDWKQSYVGKPTFISWDQSSNGKKIVVATEKHVLASLHGNNGSIVWRRVFEEDERGSVDQVLHQGSALLTISGTGRLVRSWHLATGAMMWETDLKTDSNIKSTAVLIGGNRADAIVVATPHTLFSLKITDGSKLWELELSNSDSVDYWHISTRDHDVVLVGITPNAMVNIATVSHGGKVKNQRNIPATWITAQTSCIITGEKYFICYRPDSLSLQMLDTSVGTTFTPVSLQNLGLQGTSFTKLESSFVNLNSDVPRSEFILRVCPEHMAVLTVTDSGINLIKDLPKVSAVQVVVHGEKEYLLSLRQLGTELLLSSFDLKTMEEVLDLAQKIPYTNTNGLPIKTSSLLFSRKKDGRMACKVLFVANDYSIHFRSGKMLWKREESLANILRIEMVDLPLSENQAKFEDEFGSTEGDIFAMFVKRIMVQVSQIHSFIEHLVLKLQGHRHHSAVMSDDDGDDITIDEDDDEEEELTRDEFNLNKIIIAVTASGKIFGIRSHTGKIVWQNFLVDMAPSDRYGRQTMLLYTQRTTAHFPLLPQCVILGKSRKSGNGLLYAFNPINGSPIEGQPEGGVDLGYSVIQAALLSDLSEEFVRGLVLLGDDYRVRFYPENVAAVAESRLPSMFMYVAKIDTGVISGYRIIARASGEFEADTVWNIDLQKKQQRIVNVISKSVNEHVHSQGRVLGDRSVLYKYLNPNLVAVVTEGEESSAVFGSQKSPSSFFNIYLIDGITGHIVFHVNHKRAKGPVHVVHSENWIVYSYFNERQRRPEIAVLEMFEGKEQSNSTAFSSFYPPPQPLVLRQSYIFPLAIGSMATTITEKGITSKNLIIALKNGGILSIPKALLDPRRPLLPSPETMEEGTIPYIPEIQVFTETTLNYNQSVINVAGIHTTPAGLESTSLVLAYGLDLFYTRVNPSKMFDVLKEDFDYLFIAMVLALMIGVSIVTQKLASRKALNKAWK